MPECDAGRILTDAQRELYRRLYDLTAEERDTALRRSAANECQPAAVATHPNQLPE